MVPVTDCKTCEMKRVCRYVDVVELATKAVEDAAYYVGETDVMRIADSAIVDVAVSCIFYRQEV